MYYQVKLSLIYYYIFIMYTESAFYWWKWCVMSPKIQKFVSFLLKDEMNLIFQKLECRI